mmetsp:Transcript_74866/g.167749  ORF Transcript_74866/g.167749 Transcript_74866/m.167749 type:complete len:369 (-) Transcript_74866:73-1179(-)
MSFRDAADAVAQGDLDALRRHLDSEPGLVTEEGVYDEVMESVDAPCAIKMAPVIGTLLNLAVKYNRVDHAELLLERGAEVNCLETIYWHSAAAESRTPLYTAVWGSDEALTALLLRHGADTHRPSGPPGSGVTPLEEATQRGLTEIVRSLLDARAEIAPDGAEDHLLCRAIQGQHRDVVELLLERGAKVSQTEGQGPSPLHLAARRNCPEIARLLLERGVGAAEDQQADTSALLQVTSTAQAEWEEYVESANPGLERDWRAQMREEHMRLVQLLLDRGALKVAPGSLEHVSSVFQHFDRNGDGVIQREELVQVLQLLDGESWTDERIDELVAAADANRDGQIQFDEFLRWVFGNGDPASSMNPVAALC